jgi:hypothetical protein
MLHDLDSTLEKLLINEGKINKSEIDIAFEQPTGEWSARLSRPTLNMYCYDLRENIKLRSMEHSMNRDMPANNSRTTVAPRRMNVSYLVTAWARKIQDEHQLLWRALATLKRYSFLDPQACEGLLRYQTYRIPLTVADLTDHPVNITDLWSVMDNQMRLGFIVVATVELDTELSIESPLVLEGTIRIGQSERPETKTLSVKDVELKHNEESNKRREGNHTTE